MSTRKSRIRKNRKPSRHRPQPRQGRGRAGCSVRWQTLATERAGAVISQSTTAAELVSLFKPADVPRGDAQNVRRVPPAQLSLDGLQNDLFPRHCLRLLGDAVLDAFHRTTIADWKRTSLSAYAADISTASYTRLLVP